MTNPIRFRDSLIAKTCLRMALRITEIVIAVTLLSYWHIVHTLSEETKDKLLKYIAERGAKESAIFIQAADNLEVLRRDFLERYAGMPAPTDAQFRARSIRHFPTARHA